MINKEAINQTKLFGLEKYLKELIRLKNDNNLPNKILFSGQKGIGKSTLAYHFVNFVLSEKENFNYDIQNFEIQTENQSYKTILNKSNINFCLIDINNENKFIDINQIRELISRLNKSSLNDKPRFVLIDNIEFLNINSINALLKILEEPPTNTYFILINNNKKILPTLLSRCLNFKISLSNKKCIEITNRLLEQDLNEILNKDLINYYSTPGNIFNLIKFGNNNDYDLKNIELKDFLKKLIQKKQYKKDSSIKYLIFDFIEFYFNKINLNISFKFYHEYIYFLKRMSDTKKFNLDEESLFIEFEEKILNG